MKRPIILLLVLLGFFSEALSQTHVYLGGGISALRINWLRDNEIFFGEEGKGKGVAWSYNFSMLAKSDVSNNMALSLGVMYNVNEFEYSASSRGIDPFSGAFYSRYAIPSRLHWTVYSNIYLSGGVSLNSLYRQEFRFSDGGVSSVSENYRPDFSIACGVGGEWKHFLLDVLFGRSLSESELSFRNHYWTIDFNVYYRILSSEKE